MGWPVVFQPTDLPTEHICSCGCAAAPSSVSATPKLWSTTASLGFSSGGREGGRDTGEGSSMELLRKEGDRMG